MKRGSITPFCAVSVMLIASLLFALLESARVYGLDCYAGLKAETGIDSVCAEDHPFLWEEYGLLFLDAAYGTGHFSEDYMTESMENHMSANCDSTGWIQEKMALDLMRAEVEEVQLEGYALATDAGGDTFLTYVAERAKEKLPLGLAEDLYQQYQKTQKLECENTRVEASVLEAEQVLRKTEAEWFQKQKETDSDTDIKPDTSALKNVLASAGNMQNSGILNLIYGDLSGISQKYSCLSDNLGNRKKMEGNMYFSEKKEWYRKLLVLEYMEEFFSSYTNKKEGHFLEYEMEYVITGNVAERKNLEEALERILLIREAANVTYLLQDKGKMALVDGLAGAVGLIAGENPGVVKVIQIGIVAAWAYMESILDVRELVAGGCIPLIKQAEEWTTTFTGMLTAFDKSARANACTQGLRYADYLKQILFFVKDSEVAYRMMEVMEMGMRQKNEFENGRMNHMVVAMRYKLCFQSQPLFSSLVSVGEKYNGDYYFWKNVERSYVP